MAPVVTDDEPGTSAEAAENTEHAERADRTSKVDDGATVSRAGTPQSARTSTERRAAQSESLEPARGRRSGRGPRTGTTTRDVRSGARTTTRRAGRTATDRDGVDQEGPVLPRGRIATAFAAVLTALAARLVTWPGGPRVVEAGRWTRTKVRRYLDGPRPERMSLATLRWQHRRRSAYATLGAMVGIPLLMLGLGWLFIPIPNADEAVESQLNTISYSDGTMLARVAPGEQGNRQKVFINQIPKPVQFAVLSAEDRTFFSNSGFDLTGIVRAAFKQATGGVGGGSTITQQYVKNAMVGDEYSLTRKYKELIISSKLNQEMSKDQILELYLNSIYFGRGAYGIQAASQAYFNKPVQTLTPAEGALLAGIIQSPSRWDPAVKPEDSVRRWNYVMDGMVTSGWLSPAERTAARFPTTVPPRKVTNGVPDDDRGHVYSLVKQELKSIGIDEDALVTEGLQIQTTIQPDAQRQAAEATRKEMAGQPGNLRSATVSIDPRNGNVLAYYGGQDGSGLDYAQVQKQAGSTFKPFVLLAALQQNPPIGISTEFDGQSVPGKTVRNVDGADCSACNLKRAMTVSNNVVYTALGNKVGPQAIANAAHQAGVTQKLADPTSGIALGNAEVTPMEMATAYATFAGDGVWHKPHLVQKVTTSSGEVLYDHATDQGEQRIDPKVARNVTEAMRDVPEYDDAQLSGGRIAAAKTGTVQSHVEDQNNDAWMVGYTPGASTAIWVGTDDNTPIRTADGKPVYGHGLPSEIWKSFMDEALQGTPKQTFGSFVPVAGGDPGDTATGPGQQEGARSGDSSTSTSPSSSSSGSSQPSTSASASPSASRPADARPGGGRAPAPAEPPRATPSAPAAASPAVPTADPESTAVPEESGN